MRRRRINGIIEELLSDDSEHEKPDKENKDKDSDDDDDDGDAYKLFKNAVTHTTYDVYLGESVQRSTEYYELFNKLSNATKNDKFRVHLNNFGGCCHTGVQLMNAFRKTKGHVQMIIEAPVYSMASILAVCVKDVVVEPHTFLMFHDYSTWELGKGSEIAASVGHYQPYFKRVLKDACEGFLTTEEINNICKGQDLYVSDTEAKKRLKKRSEK